MAEQRGNTCCIINGTICAVYRLQANKRECRPTVTDGLDLDCLGDPLFWIGLRRLTANFGFEESVHQSGLPQAALS